jgi:hypothetical protein
VNCPTGMGPWLFSISKTVQPDNTIPEPQLGYAGPATRLRYDSLAGGGTVIKINTYDASAHMTPWDYNFQAAQTNIAEIQLNTVSHLKLEVQLGVRNEQDFFFYDPSLCGPGGGIESGNIPWIHTIVGSVFRSRTQNLGYFLEIVPFYREHQISNGDCYANSPSTFGTGGPSNSPNARISIADPAISSFVSLPSPMLVGEIRTIVIDLKPALQAIFPNANLDDLNYTGSYIGTEQYGESQIGLNLRRLSVQPTY